MISNRFKQRFLYEAAPHTCSFEEARNIRFQLILDLFSTHPNEWLPRGIDGESLINSYKRCYGLTCPQVEQLITIFTNIAFSKAGICSETRSQMLRILNFFSSAQFHELKGFRIDNEAMLQIVQNIAEFGKRGSPVQDELCFDEMCEFIRKASKMGQDITPKALHVAMRRRDLRYLVLFIKSLKSEANAEAILKEIFDEAAVWDRDLVWFYILMKIACSQFPSFCFGKYHQKIFQQFIRVFTLIANPPSEQIMNKITGRSTDSFGLMSILHSTAMIMVSLIRKDNSAEGNSTWFCIERVFSLITQSLHPNSTQQTSINSHLDFLLKFAIQYILLYNKERGIHYGRNLDVIDLVQDAPAKQLILAGNVEAKFDSLWPEIMGKLLFFQDCQNKPAEILLRLVLYKPGYFLPLALAAQQKLLERDDLSMISLNSSKAFLLKIQKVVVIEQTDHLRDFTYCYRLLLSLAEKLGLSEHADVMEGILLMFTFLNYQTAVTPFIQDFKDEIVTVIFDNLDAISLGLGQFENFGPDLYLSTGNKFYPFFFIFTEKQIKAFEERFLYRLTTTTPQHMGGYQQITECLSFLDSEFTTKVMKFVYPHLVTELQTPKAPLKHCPYLGPLKHSLHSTNEYHVKWYCILIQSIFKYQPQQIVIWWSQIEGILRALSAEDNENFRDISFEMLSTFTHTICQNRVPPAAFTDPKNARYETLNIPSEPIPKETRELIEYIFDRYFVQVSTFLHERYDSFLPTASRETVEIKSGSGPPVQLPMKTVTCFQRVFDCEAPLQDQTEERKLFYLAISIQFSVFSAVSFRSRYQSEPNRLGTVEGLIKEFLKNACQYTEWICQVFAHIKALNDPFCLRVFSFFWSEYHHNKFFDATLRLNQNFIDSHLKGSKCQSKLLSNNSYILVSEAIVHHYLRAQIDTILSKFFLKDIKQYLQTEIILSLNTNFEVNQSFVSRGIDVHEYHRELIALMKYEFDTTNPRSYIAKLLSSQDSAQAERYFSALQALIFSLKKCFMRVCTYACCLQDSFIRNFLVEILASCRCFPKNSERKVLSSVIRTMHVFEFEIMLLLNPDEEQPVFSESSQHNWGYWSLKEGAVMHEKWSITNVASTIHTDSPFKILPFKSHYYKSESIVSFVENILTEMRKTSHNGEREVKKDASLYILIAIPYLNCLPLNHPIVAQAFNVFSEVGSTEGSEVYETVKFGLFRILNRFYVTLRKVTKKENIPVRRDFDTFLELRQLGDADFSKVRSDVLDYNLIHEEQITLVDYARLGDDPSRITHSNELSVLKSLQSDTFKSFLKGALQDLSFKSEKPAINLAIAITEDFAYYSPNLLHLFWDIKPDSNSMFGNYLSSFQAPSYLFYIRLFRRVLRLSPPQFHNSILKLALSNEENNQSEETKLSLCIASELLLDNPSHEEGAKIGKYLVDCSKEQFDHFIYCLSFSLKSNFAKASQIYTLLKASLLPIKRAGKLRYLQLLCVYCSVTGRYATKTALGFLHSYFEELSLESNEEMAANQVAALLSEIIVNIFSSPFSIAALNHWAIESPQSLLKQRRIYSNDSICYLRDDKLHSLIKSIVQKAQMEGEREKKGLQRNCNIIQIVLSRISVSFFEEGIYTLLQPMLKHVLDRPPEDLQEQEQGIDYSNSEYPEPAYSRMVAHLSNLNDLPPSVVRRKLCYLQIIVVNQGFSMNYPSLVDVFQMSKTITIEFILTYSGLASILTREELSSKVRELLEDRSKDRNRINKLMGLLMAAGARELDWKEEALKQILREKKTKLVKEFVSLWWKGRSVSTEEDYRLGELVKGVENPYSYFA